MDLYGKYVIRFYLMVTTQHIFRVIKLKLFKANINTFVGTCVSWTPLCVIDPFSWFCFSWLSRKDCVYVYVCSYKEKGWNLAAILKAFLSLDCFSLSLSIHPNIYMSLPGSVSWKVMDQTFCSCRLSWLFQLHCQSSYSCSHLLTGNDTANLL